MVFKKILPFSDIIGVCLISVRNLFASIAYNIKV